MLVFPELHGGFSLHTLKIIVGRFLQLLAKGSIVRTVQPTSYWMQLPKRLSSRPTQGAKKVHSIKRLLRMEDLSRQSTFRGGPGFVFFDSLIMTAAHFYFTEH